ncbi:MAG: CaiB/BaiF CoA transferase family protein [Nitriliruptoraceae bacterium]
MRAALDDLRIVELAAIGPVPYGVMLLADLGAEVIRVDRVAAAQGRPGAEASMVGLSRNRRSVAVDLKQPAGIEVVRRLARSADVVVEGFRPGVAERLGIGPEELRSDHPGLIYARVTGWGQDGPLAPRAGHDLDYAAVAGALHGIGEADRPPPPPINYLADFAGGGAFLAIGVLAAVVERHHSGEGQVLDVAMVDGAASLTAFLHGLRQLGAWSLDRNSNLLDGASPFYRAYRCADGRFLAVAALEPQFHEALCRALGLDPAEWPQHEPARWPQQTEALGQLFATRDRDAWVAMLGDDDTCVAPVLDLDEAPAHPHNQARRTFVEAFGTVQPAPAPRLSRTPGGIDRPPPGFGQHTDEVLTSLGYRPDDLTRLRAAGAIA